MADTAQFVQETYGEANDYYPDEVPANESRMACLFLLDNSISMYGESIRSLNGGMNRFKVDVCKDEQTRKVLDVAVISFNDKFKIEQDWTGIENMANIDLQASGGTLMTPAIKAGLTKVDERYRYYMRNGAQPYKPWIVMVSDGGENANVNEVSAIIKDMEAQEKLNFISLGVDGYDANILTQLSGSKVIRLVGHDFTSFFDWVAKSFRAVSNKAPGANVPLAPMPPNLQPGYKKSWFDN